MTGRSEAWVWQQQTPDKELSLARKRFKDMLHG